MRTKPPKEIQTRREENHKKSKKNARRRVQFDWKFWTSLVIGLAGLMFATIGLQARPTVSLEAPLDPANVFTTPIVISNDGWFPLNDVRVVSYYRRVEYENNIIINNASGLNYVPPTATLGVGERATVPLGQIFKVETIPLLHADLGLVVFFKPSYLWFWRKRKAFRFVTVSQSDGSMRLQQQASEDTLERFDRHIEKMERWRAEHLRLPDRP